MNKNLRVKEKQRAELSRKLIWQIKSRQNLPLTMLYVDDSNFINNEKCFQENLAFKDIFILNHGS